MQKTRGFTLLELVIVVAIIGLLASIALVPNLIRFQQRAAASHMKAAATQIATAFELAAAEGCTSVDINTGGVMQCDSPAQVLIQSLPALPSAGPGIDLDSACDTGSFTQSSQDQNPSATPLDFCVRRFLAGSGVFVCEQGSCACTVDGDCIR